MKIKIGDITKIRTGKLDANAADGNGQYPFFTCSKEPLKINTYSYDCECVLVAGNGDLNVKYYNGKFDAYQRTYIIEDDSDGLLFMPYLYFFMESYIDELRKQSIGGVIKYIKLKNLTDALIELPCIEVQRKIVNIISKSKEIVRRKENEFELLDELVRARFVEMFGDPIQNSKGYPIRQFSDYIISLTSGSRGWAKYCVNDGKEWFITIKNVKDCNIITDNIQPINAPSNAEAKRTKVEEGDLLISITADLGRTGVVTKEVAEHGAYINQHLSCIRIDREILNPLYVAYYMESSAGKRQFIQKNQSAVKAGLNFNSINSLKLLVPPMEEQNKFIRFVKQIDKSRLLSNHSLLLLKSIIF